MIWPTTPGQGPAGPDRALGRGGARRLAARDRRAGPPRRAGRRRPGGGRGRERREAASVPLVLGGHDLRRRGRHAHRHPAAGDGLRRGDGRGPRRAGRPRPAHPGLRDHDGRGAIRRQRRLPLQRPDRQPAADRQGPAAGAAGGPVPRARCPPTSPARRSPPGTSRRRSRPRGSSTPGPDGLDGEIVNLPTRAIQGWNWDGAEHCWWRKPAHYGAIHFHDDDIYDAGWQERLRAGRCRTT